MGAGGLKALMGGSAGVSKKNHEDMEVEVDGGSARIGGKPVKSACLWVSGKSERTKTRAKNVKTIKRH